MEKLTMENREELASELLHEFAHGFFGYGSLHGDLWFVGMEEASAGTLADSQRRLGAWKDRGKPTVDHLREYHEAIGVTECFDERPRLQPTWRGLMRIAHAVKQQRPSRDDLRVYQRDQWGKSDGDVALLELFPLPKPSRKSWPYKDWTTLQWLSSDLSYRQFLAGYRKRRLRELAAQYRPRAIVFYGAEHIDHYTDVCGPLLAFEGTRRPTKRGTMDGAQVWHMWHPAYLPNADFETIGNSIAAS
jgi:hypothetical protein